MTSDVQAKPVELVHHPRGTGPTVWFGDAIYTFHATKASTNGMLTLCEATVPPGGGPPPHIHEGTDEAFFVLGGELEFLNGESTFRAGEGDFVWVPRGHRHRFRNVGLHTARLIFMFTPGGMDGYFNEIGTPAQPGVPPAPLTEHQRHQIVDLAPYYGLLIEPPAPPQRPGGDAAP